MEIEIENVHRVETNFWKRSRSTFIFSRSRFLKSRLFSRDFVASRFLLRLSRHIEIVEICQDLSRFVKICRDLSRFVKTQSRFVEMQSRFVEKSRRENTKIHALLDRDKLSRNAKIFRSQRISWSRSRLFGLDIDVETKLRNLDRDRDFSIVETNFWKPSRLSITSRLILFLASRQIETPKAKNLFSFALMDSSQWHTSKGTVTFL